MMKFKLPWRSSAQKQTELSVDYSQDPSLPNGAAKVIRHIPAHNGVLTLKPGDLKLQEMPRGTTYDEYFHSHTKDRLCDVMILDSFIREITKDMSKLQHILKQYFGEFAGQIFFLGTAFESSDGRECVPYLNINTHQPALRYICPSAHPVNHDVLCCACFLEKDVAEIKSLPSH